MLFREKKRILWINGAFGAGKSITALELSKKIKNSTIFDPEEVGFYIRDNLPKSLIPDDFQDIHLWRSFNYEMLKYTYNNSEHDIIVPMTIVNDKYYDEILNSLRKDKIEVRHFVLMASKEVLLNRLNGRGDLNDSWAAKQIDRCLESLSSDVYENKIQTDNMSVDDVVKSITDTL